MDCDLTSGEQQEETFDPDKSVMVSSQKTEDDSQKTASGGVPGTAANLPHPPDKTSTGGGSSHRTESVTYQSSRVVKHTRIPQGVIRRMSLSVLVGQQTHFEGQGKARHSVTVPPAPETLKTIKDLVAGVTGFNADRGDQLIVETLPFESAFDTDSLRSAPAAPPKTPGPAWLEFLTKYRDPMLLALAGLGVFMVVLRTILKMTGMKSARPEFDPAAALPSADGYAAFQGPGPDRAEVGSRAGREILIDSHGATADRIKDLAQRDLDATANVLRMWMQKQKA